MQGLPREHWCPWPTQQGRDPGSTPTPSMPCPCQLWGGLESPENLLVPSSQEAATAGPPALRSPCSPSPAPAPAVLLPSKVPWEGGTGPVTKGGRMGRRGSLLTPVSIMIPHHLSEEVAH